MKCAFVASGGGLKGYAFHLGVLRALEERGFRRVRAGERPLDAPAPDIPIASYIGSSAGACVAAACVFFESLDDAEGVIGLRPTRVPRFGRSVLFRPRLGGLRPFTGVFYADAIERYFRDRAAGHNDFRTLGPEMYICATQLNGSRKVVFGPRDSAVGGRYNPYIAYYDDVPISSAIAASVSVPGFYQPYRIQTANREPFEYIDGEVRETLSVHVARDTDVDLVIVSNAWMPYHYERSRGSIAKLGIGHIIRQSLTQIVEQKIDRFRNEVDRHRAAIDAIRDFGREHRLPPAQVDALVERIAGILRYRAMDQIYISPLRNDAEFNLLPSWSYSRKVLRAALDVGYSRAHRALDRWQRRDESLSERDALPPWAPR